MGEESDGLRDGTREWKLKALWPFQGKRLEIGNLPRSEGPPSDVNVG